MNHDYHENCGGTIASATHAGIGYDYCTECRAFRFEDDDNERFPTCTSIRHNVQAWDYGDTRSPDVKP